MARLMANMASKRSPLVVLGRKDMVPVVPVLVLQVMVILGMGILMAMVTDMAHHTVAPQVGQPITSKKANITCPMMAASKLWI
jgi:hypothetical protein